MASFEEAWAFTSSWEGSFSLTATDVGDYFKPSTWAFISKQPKPTQMGTSWGITPNFLWDYVKPSMWVDLGKIGRTVKKKPVVNNENLVFPTRTIMEAIDKDIAGEMWRVTAWELIRGDEIVSQTMANLIFDWFVRAQDTLYRRLPFVLAKQPAFVGMVGIQYDVWGTRNETDPKNEKTQKVYKIGDALLARINSPREKWAGIFAKIKAEMKPKYAATNTINRWNALTFETSRIKTQNDLARKITTTDETSTPLSTWVFRGAAVYIVGKVFKIW